MGFELDHIVVSAAPLCDGTAALERALGVPLQVGGQHALFGTHNTLLSLGSEDYLEVIAVDPSAAPLPRARWYDLDRFAGPPRLTNWAIRTDDLETALSAMGDGFGTPVAVTRGDLAWRMAVPSDGILPFDNCAPAFIQWDTPPPGPRLTDQACRLEKLIVRHPEATAMAALLADHFQDDRVVFERGTPGLTAVIKTPTGSSVVA